MSYTNGLDNPELYFQTKLYTGNGGTQSITFDGSENMQPDFIWIKARNATRNPRLTDSINGVQKNLFSDLQNALTTNVDGVTAFGTNGFSVGSGNGFNGNSETHVAWNWKAGTSFSNDASATGVGTIDSTGSVNTTAGFSIILYSGTGSAGTIAHGLGAVPKMMMIKETSGNASGGNQSWSVYHQALGNTHFIPLNSAEAKIDDVDFNDTTPTSSVFSVGVSNRTNSGNGNGVYIAYCFAEKQGYSKFGSFLGNNSDNGTFVYTGFRPAWVMIKRTDTSTSTTDWFIFDNKRNTGNPNDDYLEANENGTETTSGRNVIDFLSNGFKCRQAYDDFNASGSSQIYMAFAESPLVNSNGVPNNAR